MKQKTKACGAKTRHGGTCRKAPMPNGRCRLHGGLSLAPGPTHPKFVHGRYSKALDGEVIAELYQLARQDKNLLALREDIALLVAKQQETVGRLRTGLSGDMLKVLAEQLAALRAAVAGGADCTSAVEAMDATLNGALGDEAVWAEYTQRTEQIRRLVDTERKYQEGLRMYMTLEQAQAITTLWLDAMRKTIPQEYLAAFHAEVRRLRGDAPYAPLH